MKSIRFIIFSLFGFMLLSACDTEKDSPVNPLENGNQVKFQATIGKPDNMRASGTSWSLGDAIGVYPLTSTSPFIVYDGKENVKYTTPGTGVFTAASTGITFPENGAIDFVAYYPYQETITDYTYNINTANQSNPEAIDLLYSDNATSATSANSSVALEFKHKLAMLTLNVAAGDGVTTLDGLTATIGGLKTDGTFDLTDAELTVGSTAGNISVPAAGDGNGMTVTAILVPGQNLSSSTITFSLDGKTYEWTPATQDLESGKKYSYKLQLSTTGLSVLQPNATIVDWEDGYTGTEPIVLTPEEETGDYLTVSPGTIELEATEGDAQEITVTASGAWTAVITAGSGFTVAPLNGTGNATVTVTASAASGATGTITFTLTDTSVTKEVSVSQKTAGGETGNNLFPGSDFEDWSAFLNSLNSYGLIGEGSGYAVQNETGGRNASSALHLNGTPGGNDYVFTATVPKNFSAASKTKIVFYIKGSSGKSLSLNVYKANGSNYHVFNLDAYTQETILAKADENASGNGMNSYTGAIDTEGNWMKVTLDIKDLEISSTAGQNLFALKAGRDVVYNLLIDDITIE